MNDQDGTVNWLFLDLNSFFASCEQQEHPELCGKPVAVVPMMTDSTCAIAASYEAKAFGIKTGMLIHEAKQRCPNLILVKARQKIYADYHRKVAAAVETCLPVAKICSVDEMACKLMGTERAVPEAQRLARKVKQTVRHLVGDRMICSVGLAPSLFLGKVASDMQKPDGLVTITAADLPHILHPLKLTDIYGIGRRMEQRLNWAGIGSVAELMQAERSRLRQIWGGVYGVLYYELLHGADLQFPSSPYSHSISHQHVLEPELRTMEGARQFARHLAAKGAERLRRQNYFCRRLGLTISRIGDWGYWYNETGFHETQSTDFILAQLEKLWRAIPPSKPVKVSIVLLNLVPAAHHQPDLFATPARNIRLSPLIDEINRRHGRGAIAFGHRTAQTATFTGHAAFQRVPEEYEF